MLGLDLSAGLAALVGLDAEARHTVRVASASLLAFVIDRVLHLPQGYWAVFTVVIVMQVSIGATLAASLDRMKGTLLGALVGGMAAWLHPRTTIGLGAALTAAVGVTAFCASLRPSLKVAPVTAVIMLITPAGAAISPLASALYRVSEIAIGGVIGVLAALVIFPARSAPLAAARAAEVLELLALALERFAVHLLDPDRLEGEDGLQQTVRTALGRVESAMQDADRERASRLGPGSPASALPRTLWRVRNDTISVRRALGPMPEGAAALLGEPIRALMSAQADVLRACARALRSRTPSDRRASETPFLAFEAALGDLRRSHITHELSFDAVGRLFGLAFALESLERNLGDLSDRINEAAAARDI